jgi:hypothetical protein
LREEEKVGLVVGAPGGEEERRCPVGREEGAWAVEEGRGHTAGLERCLASIECLGNAPHPERRGVTFHI